MLKFLLTKITVVKNPACSLVCALLLLSTSGSPVFAQEIHKGDFMLSPGLGVGYQFWGGITLALNGEYAFTDEISGGGYVSYTRWADNAYQKINFLDAGVRASYHFARLLRISNKRFDPYAGASVGAGFSDFDNDYEINGAQYHYNGSYDKGVHGGLYAGARWYFKDKVGVFGEVGFALCPVMVGATFKL